MFLWSLVRFNLNSILVQLGRAAGRMVDYRLQSMCRVKELESELEALKKHCPALEDQLCTRQ
jgi:hypothetical protein